MCTVHIHVHVYTRYTHVPLGLHDMYMFPAWLKTANIKNIDVM